MTAPAAPAAAPKGRLGNGQLRRQVAEYLADHPGPCKTGEIAKALDRSAGAVGNALTTLAGNGEADLVPGKPIRYQANSATAAAAAAIAPKAPLPPKPAPAPTPAPAPAAPAPVPSPAPKPALTPKPAAAGPVTRPNGQVYQPRALADMPDVEALRKLRAEGVPALLYGPPGTGKTSLIEAAFPDLITVAGDGDTTAADLVGEYTQNPDGTFTFVYGPLIRAMQEGRVLFIDDATLISPAVLAVAYPAMDGRREITVKAHKGCGGVWGVGGGGVWVGVGVVVGLGWVGGVLVVVWVGGGGVVCGVGGGVCGGGGGGWGGGVGGWVWGGWGGGGWVWGVGGGWGGWVWGGGWGGWVGLVLVGVWGRCGGGGGGGWGARAVVCARAGARAGLARVIAYGRLRLRVGVRRVRGRPARQAA